MCNNIFYLSFPTTGFLFALREAVKEVTVVTLAVSSAVGAAVLGAKAACLNLPIDYQTNTTVLEHCTLHTAEQEDGEGVATSGQEEQS